MRLSIPANQVKAIYFACEAGMGSSLMSASWLMKRLSAAKLNIEVIPKPAIEVPYDAQVVVTPLSSLSVLKRPMLLF
jgi:mannitol PTS system EIICBA or EIICB component